MTSPYIRLAAAAALSLTAACGHAAPPAATPRPTASFRAAADDDTADRARVEGLVRAAFAAEGGLVAHIELYPTDRPRAYVYACYYAKFDRERRCLYTARGLVDLNTGRITARRYLDDCLLAGVE